MRPHVARKARPVFNRELAGAIRTPSEYARDAPATTADPEAIPTKAYGLNPNSRFRGQHLLLVTGRLAEPALQRIVAELQDRYAVRLSVQVMPITVAALMTTAWIARHLEVPANTDRIVLPGYCQGDVDEISRKTGLPAEIGPHDLRALPEWFGEGHPLPPPEKYTIEIIAEINHAPRLTVESLVRAAESLVSDGADIIDLGCIPGSIWHEAGTAVTELMSRGMRVSIDSLQTEEIAVATRAGAGLVLSVNSSNRNAAADWGCEVVAIPDDPADWSSLEATVDFLIARGVPFRIDPILEPVGLGFTTSLARYMKARTQWPELPMMMGIGNLTELTDVDSAGINVLLLAICEELRIRSVLTTQVINWARSSVRECDIARRLVHAAVDGVAPPKNLDPRLVCLRDPRLREPGEVELTELATAIRDLNYRIAVSGGKMHVLGGGKHWSDTDPFALFERLLDETPKRPDASHAFYLGFELCKATIALQLGKQYEQDTSLRWGHLTREETTHVRLKRRRQYEDTGLEN
jgi:dihydropteroate synthase